MCQKVNICVKVLNKHNPHFFSFKNQNSLKILVIMSRKGDFEIPRVIKSIFSIISVPNKYSFWNSTVSWGRKNRTIWGLPVVIKSCHQGPMFLGLLYSAHLFIKFKFKYVVYFDIKKCSLTLQTLTLLVLVS